MKNLLFCYVISGESLKNANLNSFLYTALLTACTKPETSPAEPVLSTVTTLAGNGRAGSVNGPGVAAAFNQPQGIALDAHGVLYVADGRSYCIRKVAPSGEVSTLAGAGTGMGGYVDGPAATAQFGDPTGIAIDDQGNVYVSEYFGNKIRKITPAGTVSTFAGDSAGTAGRQDGPRATARFYGPNGLAVDKQGTLYVAESFNHRIRKISPSGIVEVV